MLYFELKTQITFLQFSLKFYVVIQDTNISVHMVMCFFNYYLFFLFVCRKQKIQMREMLKKTKRRNLKMKKRIKMMAVTLNREMSPLVQVSTFRKKQRNWPKNKPRLVLINILLILIKHLQLMVKSKNFFLLPQLR